MRMTPRVIVKKLIRRWSISSSARCCDRHALLMISWFTTTLQKNVSDNGSDWFSYTTRRRSLASSQLQLLDLHNDTYDKVISQWHKLISDPSSPYPWIFFCWKLISEPCHNNLLTLDFSMLLTSVFFRRFCLPL